MYGLAMPCILLHRLYIMERLKWQQKCANAADRGDRVESVRNRVYSIIYSSFISVQFVGVQVFLLRVNRACKACTASIAVAVGSNLVVLYLNTFVLAQPLSPKVKYELICEKKWLVECMDEEWSESPWNEVGLKRDVGDAEWKCGFIDI